MNYFPKILVTGGNGQLANALAKNKLPELEVICCSKSQLDITDVSNIDHALMTWKPDFVINAAAFTAVDLAEEEQASALRVNHDGTKTLSIACQRGRIPLLHISTDYVFDGEKSTPYRETDVTHPINHYGFTKKLSEQVVQEHCEQHIILRTSGVFSEYGHNFLLTLLRLLATKKQINIVYDQLTCPTYAIDIAAAIFSVIKQYLQGRVKTGIFHFCSAETLSWYEFSLLTLQELKAKNIVYDFPIHAITANEYAARARRPAYSALDCTKLRRDFSINQPSVQAALQRALQAIEV